MAGGGGKSVGRGSPRRATIAGSRARFVNRGLRGLCHVAYLRPERPGASIFFTVTPADRGSDVLGRHVDVLRAAARQTRVERSFGIDAWVVLPDHMHCMWRMPEGDAAYSVRWSIIKARFSRMMLMGDRPTSHVQRREHGIWQRRFWEHHIRDEADWQAHVRYCWMNPVKHGFVGEPWEWPHSSWHRDNRT